MDYYGIKIERSNMYNYLATLRTQFQIIKIVGVLISKNKIF